MARRIRAISPFLPKQSDQENLPRGSSLALALRSLPDSTENLSGPLSTEDIPAQVVGVRTELTQEQIDQGSSLLSALQEKNVNAYASNSRKSMRSDWKHWMAFCASRDRVAMPISFADLTEFMDALIEAGYKRASLEHLLFTLNLASQVWSCPSPTNSLLWKSYWRDRRRQKLHKRQTQAQALNVEDLVVIAESIDMEDPRSIRDALFAACAYDLMARASELVARRWEFIVFEADSEGGANYIIDRSKTDQDGEGAVTYLSPETVALLRIWREHCNPKNPYVFHALPRYAGQVIDGSKPLNVREASRIFDRVSERSKIDKDFSGHSGRVGGAQDMTRAGMSLPQIMQAGRWKSPRMPARYAENELATKAGQGRRDAIAKLRKK